MKILLYIFTILFFALPAEALNAEIENKFLQNINIPFILTNVPRGIIASFDEKLFFSEGEYKIKCSGTEILDKIGMLFGGMKYTYVIEGHTSELNGNNKYFKNNWELSLARANSIAKYLISCFKISPDKIFSVGFGESMPLEGHAEFKNRIDFVVIDYEY